MSRALPMTATRRVAVYLKQTGRREMTPRQKRRTQKKIMHGWMRQYSDGTELTL